MPDQPTIRVLIVDDIAETRDNLEKLCFSKRTFRLSRKLALGAKRWRWRSNTSRMSS
jgi:hypothetical protein